VHGRLMMQEGQRNIGTHKSPRGILDRFHELSMYDDLNSMCWLTRLSVGVAPELSVIRISLVPVRCRQSYITRGNDVLHNQLCDDVEKDVHTPAMHNNLLTFPSRCVPFPFKIGPENARHPVKASLARVLPSCHPSLP
jgi:hypothetical protein